MGGRIWAENNKGRGATFAFDLTAPRAIMEAEVQSNVSDLAGFDLKAAPHILIVDDNATNRVVAQALCEMFGCSSELAEDGLEALQAVQESRYDLVLMDIKMPRMDGVQATQAIRALPAPMGALPILALTANADERDEMDYVAAGMNGVAQKPIQPDALLNAIRLVMTAAAEAALSQAA